MYPADIKKLRRTKRVEKQEGLLQSLREVYFGGLKRIAKENSWPIRNPKAIVNCALFYYHSEYTKKLFPYRNEKNFLDYLTEQDVIDIIIRGRFYMENYTALKIDHKKYNLL